MHVRSARLTVESTFEVSGSMLAGTAVNRLSSLRTTLRVDADATDEAVRSVVDQAERMCFVLDAIERPHVVERVTIVNGTPPG